MHDGATWTYTESNITAHMPFVYWTKAIIVGTSEIRSQNQCHVILQPDSHGEWCPTQGEPIQTNKTKEAKVVRNRPDFVPISLFLGRF